MKVKKSFVTNSSSTSFVGFGIMLERSTDLYNKLKDIIRRKDPDAKLNEGMEDEDYFDIYELIEHALGGNSILRYACPDDYVLFGDEYSNMPLDMTRREFEEKISQELLVLGFTEKPSLIDETWYS